MECQIASPVRCRILGHGAPFLQYAEDGSTFAVREYREREGHDESCATAWLRGFAESGGPRLIVKKVHIPSLPIRSPRMRCWKHPGENRYGRSSQTMDAFCTPSLCCQRCGESQTPRKNREASVSRRVLRVYKAFSPLLYLLRSNVSCYR